MGNDTIQKHMREYFKQLKSHVDKWNEYLEKSNDIMKGLSNQSEQLRSIEKVDLSDEIKDFETVNELLLFKVLAGIDEELLQFRIINDGMCKPMQDLRMKLITFERSTLDVDWENPSEVRWNVLQPELSTTLQIAYDSWNYYNEKFEIIKELINDFNPRDEEVVRKLSGALKHTDYYNEINYTLALMSFCIEGEK